jgi:chitodextrinase
LSLPAPHHRNLVALLFCLTLAACGGGGGGSSDSVDSSSGGTTSTAVNVTVAPVSATLPVGSGSQHFTAEVANASDDGVTWSVGGVTGGNATVGTISASGEYSAPDHLPSPSTVTVMAVANADPTKTASATVILMQPSAPLPTAPTALVASNVTLTSVELTWAASTDAGGPGVGGYYVYRNGVQIASTAGTSYTDSGLTGSANYNYQVAAFDEATPPNVSALSTAVSVTTSPDTQAPTVPTGLTASSIATGSITLSWSAATDLPNPGGTGVGGYHVYRNGVLVATTTGKSYTDSPLTASTSYSYQVAAFDKATPPNVSALSVALSVTTLADTQAPTVPSGLKASSIANASITLSWSASTDLPNPGGTGVGGYYVYRNGVRIATTTTASYVDTGLTISTNYSYQVAAFDKATPPNVSALSAALSVTTSADTQAPTVPAGLTSSNVTISSVTLSWSASTDLPNPGGTGVGGYYVYRNGVRIATTTATSYADSGLTGSTTYSYQVAAFDKATPPNVSALSAALSVTTSPDTQAPTVPTGLAATSIATGSIKLGWTASTDLPVPGATGVGGYYVYRNGVRIATTTGTGYTDSPLTASTSYSYQVAAFDKATPANVSALSAALNVTTLADTQAPTVPTGLTTSGIASGSVTLSWNASTDLPNPGGTGVGGYYVYRNGTNIATTTATGYTNSGLAASTTYSYQVAAFDKATPPNVSALSGAVSVGPNSDVLTYHNDTMRTGQNLTEYTLTATNVTSATFGLLQILPADDPVDATPLIASQVSISGVAHNVVYVATENDSVYAYDADSFALLAHVSLVGAGETPSDTRSCYQVKPEIGITSTPVIDRSIGPNGTLFVEAMSKDASGNYYHRLHALDLVTLADNVPAVVIQATASGSGTNSSGGVQTFQPGQYKERGALLAANGQIYTVWASNCDFVPYNGWIMAYNESTLARTVVFNYTPSGTDGAIWNVSGLAADSAGALYGLAGNGTFDTTLTGTGFPSMGDYGNTAVKMSAGASSLTVTDYFAATNTVAESNVDTDLGSGSPLLLPDQTDSTGTTRHLMIGAGKDGNLLVLDRDNMGKFNATTNQAYQFLSGALPGGLFSAFAYFNGSVYVADVGGTLKAFALTQALLGATPTSQSTATFPYPGASPAISANGTSNGILWAVVSGNGGAAVLHAYNPANLAQEYYNSTQAPSSRDAFGNGEKYITPVIVNGKVYVGTPSGVAVFGLL